MRPVLAEEKLRLRDEVNNVCIKTSDLDASAQNLMKVQNVNCCCSETGHGFVVRW